MPGSRDAPEPFEVAPDVYGFDLGLHDSKVLSGYVVDGDAPTVVEPGHPKGADALAAGLREVGVDPGDVANVVVSHVHLDHAGAAAAVVDAAPDATVYIHESTASLLVDPTTLVESSKRVMGEQFEDVGAPNPVPEANVEPVGDDGRVLDLGDRALELHHAPGHAPDHLAARLSDGDVLFANEAVGSYYVKADTWLPPATLPQFSVSDVVDTIETLRGLDAERVALSHFGVRDDPAATFDLAADRLAAFDEAVPALYDEHDGDVEATERAVEAELLDLDGYADALVAMQTRVQTRGFLRANDLL